MQTKEGRKELIELRFLGVPQVHVATWASFLRVVKRPTGGHGECRRRRRLRLLLFLSQSSLHGSFRIISPSVTYSHLTLIQSLSYDSSMPLIPLAAPAVTAKDASFLGSESLNLEKLPFVFQ